MKNREPAPRIQLTDIHKTFESNAVLKGVSLTLMPGDVMAIIGGNGAGKSTLMKIIMGLKTLDQGEIRIDGEKVSIGGPSDALSRGIYYVPQEPMLFPDMTIEENILMGLGGGKARKLAAKKKLAELLGQLEWKVDFGSNADTLSIAGQQLVEILKGLIRDARVLILDEPTSALTFNETQALFKVIRQIQEDQISIFYITHRLTEVFEIATHVAVLRDGLVSSCGKASEYTKEMLIQALLPCGCEAQNGGVPGEAPCKSAYKPVDYAGKQPLLRTEGLSGYGFRDVSLCVYPGEVLGLAGIVGAGRTEFAEAVFGVGKVLSGKVYLEGEDITGRKTSEIIHKGLNYLPEDRHLNGIYGIADIRSNLTSVSMRWLSRFFENFRRERALTDEYIRDLSIKVTGQDQLIYLLSGGNQQKVVIGKTLSTNPRVVILDEPTRGIDASARADVYKIISQLKEKGLGVLLISSDLEEIAEVSDRAVSMFSGRINAELKHDEIKLDSLMSVSFGVGRKDCAS